MTYFQEMVQMLNQNRKDANRMRFAFFLHGVGLRDHAFFLFLKILNVSDFLSLNENKRYLRHAFCLNHGKME